MTETFTRSDRVRTLTGQIIVNLTLFATYTGVLSVLLPARVAELDPAGKVASLALVTSISFGATAIAQPLIGTLSDRTTTRLGRRLPWMIAGATVGGLAVGMLGNATSVALLALLWAVGQFALNGTDIAVTAYLVDRFPSERRGLAAGAVGLAVILGGAAGAMWAGASVDRPALASWVLAGCVGLAVVAFAFLVRDTTPGRPAEPTGARERARALVRTLREHPDFLRVLIWRFGFALSYGAVYGYLLYVLTDRVGVTTQEAARFVGLGTLVAGVCVAVTVVLAGWWSDRLRRRKPFVIATGVILAIGNAVLLISPTVAAVLATAALFGIAFGLTIGVGTALGSEVLPKPDARAATGLGVMNVATNAGQALAPMLTAALVAFGGYPAVFVVSALAAMAAVAVIPAVRPR